MLLVKLCPSSPFRSSEIFHSAPTTCRKMTWTLCVCLLAGYQSNFNFSHLTDFWLLPTLTTCGVFRVQAHFEKEQNKFFQQIYSWSKFIPSLFHFFLNYSDFFLDKMVGHPLNTWNILIPFLFLVIGTAMIPGETVTDWWAMGFIPLLLWGENLTFWRTCTPKSQIYSEE